MKTKPKRTGPPTGMTKTISWKINPEDHAAVAAISTRAEKLFEKLDFWYDPLAAQMDITACHTNGNPLDLTGLLSVDDGTFSHDILGIRRNINRTTGELENCFVPRMSAKG